MRYLNAEAVRAALPMSDAIDAMKQAFGDDVEFPQRVMLGHSLFMPGRVGSVSGIKVVSTVPGNPVGTVVVFDKTGAPMGLVDGPTLTAIRTGAGAGLATRMLAPEGASILAMLGAGAMAFDQIEAVQAVRDLAEIRVWSRNLDRATKLAARFPQARPIADVVEAVSGAHIISTATPAREPRFPAVAADAVAHINAVGAYTPDMAEIPPELVRRCFRVVDDITAAAEEAGDLLQAGVEPDATMADLLVGRRQPPPGSTMFKSVGIASQDIAAAVTALKNAASMGIGVETT